MAEATLSGVAGPYKTAARHYLERGWWPFPVKGKKMGIPVGITGSNGRTITLGDVDLWEDSRGSDNVALRLPPTVVGIDVDCYEGKQGWETLQRLEAQRGKLPATWVSTSRNDGSGIRLFAVPLGTRLPGDAGPFSGVEFIQNHHRYVMTWPSIHPDTNRTYRWYRQPAKEPSRELPAVTELPPLPEGWLDGWPSGRDAGMTGGPDANARATAYSRPNITDLILDGVPPGANHDDILKDVVWDLVMQGLSDGEIYRRWRVIVDKTPPKDPSNPFTERDFSRHLRGAREKLAGAELTPRFSEQGMAWLRGLAEAARLANGTRPSDDDDDEKPGGEKVAPTNLEEFTERLLKFREDEGEGLLINLLATHERLPRSDQSSADIITDLWPNYFWFGTQSRLWRAWNGICYEPAEDANVENLLKLYAEAHRAALKRVKAAFVEDRTMAGSLEDEAEEDYREIWKRHRRYRDDLWNYSTKARILREMEASCAVSESTFDTDLNVAPCDNGVLVLGADGRVRLESHSRERLLTKRLGHGVSYDPTAVAPHFARFLETSIKDGQQRDWLQRIVGGALFARPWKGFVNTIGKSDSGKSTFSRVMQRVFGDYAVAVGIETFLETRGSSEFRTHEMKAARLVVSGEPAQGRRIDAEVVKSITGGDWQRTREPYGRFVTWRPHATIVIASNHPMRFDTGDVAMLKRVGPVGFWNTHEIDLQLESKLEKELSGILNWVITGAEIVAAEGYTMMPASMKELREAMAEDTDECLQFLKEQLNVGQLIEDKGAPASKCVLTGEVYRRYQIWCGLQGVRNPAGQKQFSQRIGRLWEVKSSNGRRFMGLTDGM